MGIPLGGRDIIVPKKSGDFIQVNSKLCQPGSKGMPQVVERKIINACLADCPLENSEQSVLLDFSSYQRGKYIITSDMSCH